ncbi:hypothetical protein ACH5RR_029351 [Cinchona calisaya]|uniref:Uncharacterized protein n=1 Tax=Cinchona calisaya TaxID=153742 RepID=A0ABD2YVA1_9GENT
MDSVCNSINIVTRIGKLVIYSDASEKCFGLCIHVEWQDCDSCLEKVNDYQRNYSIYKSSYSIYLEEPNRAPQGVKSSPWKIKYSKMSRYREDIIKRMLMMKQEGKAQVNFYLYEYYIEWRFIIIVNYRQCTT